MFVCFTSVAYAETIYIQIPILANNPIYNSEDFSADYLATTGEVWVMLNMQEQAGVNMMMGSSRATEAQVAELKTRWPMMSWYKQIDNEYPPGWVQKAVEP